MKVINFFGGPAARKSTLAAATYVALKERGIPADLVREYATYLILSGREAQLKQDQLSVLAKQHHLQDILRGKVDVAVTDSPLPLNALYAAPGTPASFSTLVFDYFNQFDNINIFLDVDWSTYNEVNRVHTKAQAREKHEMLRNMLDARAIPYHVLPLDSTGRRVSEIMSYALGKL